MKRRNRAYRLLRLTAVYLLLLPFLLLGWLYRRLPDRVYLEPGQALLLPRFGWVSRCILEQIITGEAGP